MDSEKDGSTPFIDIYEFHFFMYNISCYSHVNLKVAWQKLLHAIVHHVACAVLIVYNFVSLFMTYQALTDKQELIFVLTMTGMTIGCTMKMCVMEYYKDKILDLHRELNERLALTDLTGRKMADGRRWNTKREFQFITKAFYLVLPGAFAVYMILPASFPGEKALPYLFPVKNLNFPYYEMVYIGHGILSFLVIVNTVSYNMIFLGLLLRLSANTIIITEGIRKIGEFYPQANYSKEIGGYSDYPRIKMEEDEEMDVLFRTETTQFLTNLKRFPTYDLIGDYDERLQEKIVQFLSEVVRHQQKITKQVNLVDKIFNFNLFIEVVGGTGIFCMAAASSFGVHFNLLKDIRLSGFALAGFIDIFLHCYCGSRFFQSKEDLRTSLYSLPWYAMDVKVRKMLIFMMTRLQRIKGVMVWRMWNVSLDVFLGLLKFSHSFIALLSEF